MSDAAWGLSFGKFLELSFSNHAAASRVASCGHSLHRDCLRFYGYVFIVNTNSCLHPYTSKKDYHSPHLMVVFSVMIVIKYSFWHLGDIFSSFLSTVIIMQILRCSRFYIMVNADKFVVIAAYIVVDLSLCNLKNLYNAVMTR